MKAVNLLTSLEKKGKSFWIVTGFASIGVVGILDFLTGYELSVSFFYLIPIVLVTWFTGRRFGIVASVTSSFIWLITNVAAGQLYSHPIIYVWNTLIRFGFFLFATFLLAALRTGLEHERELAHIDYLTGAINSRCFFDLVQTQIDRSKRDKDLPFTIVYIDIDNFKAVNDQFGHTTGDRVLQAIVNQAQIGLRKTDVVARLGGDEFVLLLPETNQEAAQVVLSKLQHNILVAMQQNNWPVTFSAGVLTCAAPPNSTDEIMGLVDELMYSVKRSSKNDIKYATYTG
jgi:diguanylate cyclase (GGDEF)-like protein